MVHTILHNFHRGTYHCHNGAYHLYTDIDTIVNTIVSKIKVRLRSNKAPVSHIARLPGPLIEIVKRNAIVLKGHRLLDRYYEIF